MSKPAYSVRYLSTVTFADGPRAGIPQSDWMTTQPMGESDARALADRIKANPSIWGDVSKMEIVPAGRMSDTSIEDEIAEFMESSHP